VPVISPFRKAAGEAASEVSSLLGCSDFDAVSWLVRRRIGIKCSSFCGVFRETTPPPVAFLSASKDSFFSFG